MKKKIRDFLLRMDEVLSKIFTYMYVDDKIMHNYLAVVGGMTLVYELFPLFYDNWAPMSVSSAAWFILCVLKEWILDKVIKQEEFSFGDLWSGVTGAVMGSLLMTLLIISR